MKYREMLQKDIATIFKVRTSTRENRMTMEELADLGITSESVSQALKVKTKGWVCEEAGKILGFTVGDGDSGEILVVAVLPKSEGRGIGRQLMELVQNWLFSRGHKELWLMENPDPTIRAYSFYRKFGWIPTGEYKNGEHVLKLRKDSLADMGNISNKNQLS
jgi:ribosomal protein S18 acetylase RimI-like enzyme